MNTSKVIRRSLGNAQKQPCKPQTPGSAGKLFNLTEALTDGPQGTPQTLVDALANISTHLGLDWKASDRAIVRMHLRDFMAQKFGAAMFKNSDAEEALHTLFNQLFG